MTGRDQYSRKLIGVRQVTEGMLIQAVFYNNPDEYPPIVNSTRLLAPNGFSVDLLCRENGKHWNVSYPDGASVRRIDTRTGSSWKEYFGFVARVLEHADRKASIFIGHDMHGLMPARLLAYRYRLPLVYHCHDFAEGPRLLPVGSRLVRLFERIFARTADLVVVPDAERGMIMTRELCLGRQPMVVANAPLYRSPSSGKVLRDALAERNKKFEKIVLRQGRIGEGHAIEATLRSMPLWASSDWGFVLMGRVASDYLERLFQLAQMLNVVERVVLLPEVGYDQVSQFTSGADAGHALYEPIHFNNSHITTASNKIMEYMAAGLPLLVSDRPGLRSLVEKHGCGVTADESSPSSIAAAVNSLLGDPDRARQMGDGARIAFEQVFCYERQFAPFLDALQTLLGDRQS